MNLLGKDGGGGDKDKNSRKKKTSPSEDAGNKRIILQCVDSYIGHLKTLTYIKPSDTEERLSTPTTPPPMRDGNSDQGSAPFCNEE
jgi:hypothetical protein